MPSQTARRWIRRSLVVLAFCATASWPLWSGAMGAAQDTRPAAEGDPNAVAGGDAAMDPAEMMRRFQAAGRPGKFHAMLEPIVGEFDAVAELQGPEGVLTSQGRTSNAWALGQRFVRQEYSGDVMGQSFSSLSFTGYDNVAGRFQGVSMDEMSSGMFISAGTATDDGKTITFVGEATDPVTNAPREYKRILRIVGDDSHVLEMFEPNERDELVRTTTITYTRRK